MNQYRSVFFLIAVLVFAADMATKAAVSSKMVLYQSIPVIGDWVKLTYIHNSGAAFGMFQGGRWPLIAVSVAAAVLVTVMALRGRSKLSLVIPLGLILGGALGNLVDRIRLGEVVDFINVGIGTHRWPVFNVADSAVSVGVVWLALVLSRKPQSEIEPPGELSSGTPPAPSDPR